MNWQVLEDVKCVGISDDGDHVFFVSSGGNRNQFPISGTYEQLQNAILEFMRILQLAHEKKPKLGTPGIPDALQGSAVLQVTAALAAASADGPLVHVIAKPEGMPILTVTMSSSQWDGLVNEVNKAREVQRFSPKNDC